MRREAEYELNGQKVRIVELTMKQLSSLRNVFNDKPIFEVVNELLPSCVVGYTGDLLDLSPSEILELSKAIRDVNKFFLQMLAITSDQEKSKDFMQKQIFVA